MVLLFFIEEVELVRCSRRGVLIEIVMFFNNCFNFLLFLENLGSYGVLVDRLFFCEV